jgi:putative ABC transport system ATP-binding protein
MSNSTQPIVRLRNVIRAFPLGERVVRAVDDVTLDLPRGAFTAIVGRSGSGKSTLLNLIAGLDHVTSGQVEVAGAAIHTMTEDQLSSFRGRNVGFVFQFFQLLPTLTVAENVALPMDFLGELGSRKARDRALVLLDRMGIKEHADKLPSALSGGQQQRAAIARALANDPPLIVADEPTGNLDHKTASMVLSLLSELTKEGRSVVMVTHERDGEERADVVVRLSDGQVESALGQHGVEVQRAS